MHIEMTSTSLLVSRQMSPTQSKPPWRRRTSQRRTSSRQRRTPRLSSPARRRRSSWPQMVSPPQHSERTARSSPAAARWTRCAMAKRRWRWKWLRSSASGRTATEVRSACDSACWRPHALGARPALQYGCVRQGEQYRVAPGSMQLQFACAPPLIARLHMTGDLAPRALGRLCPRQPFTGARPSFACATAHRLCTSLLLQAAGRP